MHDNILYMFNYWVDPVVHLHLLKSSMCWHIGRIFVHTTRRLEATSGTSLFILALFNNNLKSKTVEFSGFEF